MSWLACYNPEINWKIEKMKMKSCLDEYEKQQRIVQEKLEWKKQKMSEQNKGKRQSDRRKEKKERLPITTLYL